MTQEFLLQAAVFLPVIAAIVIALVGERNINLREAVSLVTAIILFAVIFGIYRNLALAGQHVVEMAEPINGLSISLAAEPLGVLFALVCSFLWIVTSIYSIGYMRGHHEKHQTRFYACFALSIGSAMGVALSANLFSLFVFYELLTLVTYPLVTHSGTDEARRAGRVYLGYLLGTSIGLQLLAIVCTWSMTGTLDFTAGGIFDQQDPDFVILVIFVLFMFGIGKAALMPFHRWLPAAMVAPTPVSALLHAVAVVKAGVFSIVKISVYIFGLDELFNSGATDWLVYVSGATILIASIIALGKDNLKARLAYSTISQLSYVILATAIIAPLSIMGAALHIAAHAFGKITLFFAAGSISVASGRKNVSQLAGIGKQMPWTMTAFAIGSLSMIGVPPTAGFLSKWYILQGAWSMHNTVAITVIIISTLLNAGYFLPIVYTAFFREQDGPDYYEGGEAPVAIVLALAITALFTMVLFLYPAPLLELVKSIKL
ncbi:MAG TPA: monovalent cation/H+ antiporter subunit D family protein [Gammaproteobacteria bacterium]|nr:monovalent cation/H+ antiporter subunit D family protein [Gammaproteobacteria bacterium]